MTYSVCVGFYGLNRSARWTSSSIKKNIITPLRRHGFGVFVVGHFNRVDVMNSSWSKEYGIKLIDDNYKFGLDLDISEIQSEENICDMSKSVLSVPWREMSDTDGHMRRNMLHQLHSLRRLYSIISNRKEKFDVYVLLRPDIEYIDRININEINWIINNQVDIVTPNWGGWGVQMIDFRSVIKGDLIYSQTDGKI